MNSLPEPIEKFIQDKTSLTIFQYKDSIRNIYRIQSGIVFMDLTEKEIYNLIKILDEFNPYTKNKKKKWFGRTNK